MSVEAPPIRPPEEPQARARSTESVWRLSALALGHPTPEFHAAVESGAFQAAFSEAWAQVTGRAWRCPAARWTFPDFEAGYIAAFLHGRSGKPVASLLAGDHECALAGLTRPVLMLNVSAFYRHFGLTAATRDEGRTDEPDHVAGMLEFMSVLCHLEADALRRGGDPAPYRRAQRDFLGRYLGPTLATVAGLLRRDPVDGLAPLPMQLVQDISDFAGRQRAELEARVGLFRGPDSPRVTREAAGDATRQNLWG